MKKIILFLVVSIGLVIFPNCSKDLLDENPETFLTADQLYNTQSGFESGLNGLYALMRQEREGHGYTSSFGETGLRALINMGGTDVYNNGAGAGGEFSAIYKDWSKANVPTDKSLEKAFEWLYETVLSSNLLIARAENPNIVWADEASKERIIAEARFVRAWAYRHLTYLWGKVPLVLTEVTGDNFRTDYVREEISLIRKQIIDDLLYAEARMDWTPSQMGRATKGVVLSYLSEMYLAEAGKIEGSYNMALLDSAYNYADKCIEEGPYELIKNRLANGAGTSFTDMFNPASLNMETGNTEALWVMLWEKNVIGGGANLMRFSLRPKYDASGKVGSGIAISYYDETRGGRGFSRAALTKWSLYLFNLSSDFANNIVDDRGSEFAIAKYYILSKYDSYSGTKSLTGEPWAEGDTVWIGCLDISKCDDRTQGTINGFENLESGPSEGDNNNWPYTLKYSYCDVGYPKNNASHFDQIYMRLAETYLLRAEAAMKRGDIPQATSDINELRTRAHALTITDADVSLNLILEERVRELMGEEQRRYTLLRTLPGPEVIDWISSRNGKDVGIALRDTLFPIPQTVIDANVSLLMEQNPGF
ncbi:MAG: RagB/SusD family nutrient uptake outer membrane protein [Bacteroidales bacterium]|nr:RagB/SusD family nutrient uptake outer membrane protein [Bacteroidales bacterium]MCF8390133.1 RagB/SusD family nutrient uptake outer membrane protein [Bacteroidales bacterium]